MSKSRKLFNDSKKVIPSGVNSPVRYFDPYAGTGTGIQSLMQTFGFGNYSPGVNFMLMPIYFDVLKLQAIEFNDQIRKSAYSFELRNNKIRIFPNPETTYNLWFQYIVKKDRDTTLQGVTEGVITDVSNAPYNNMEFKEINDVSFSVSKIWNKEIEREMLYGFESKEKFTHLTDIEIYNRLTKNN